MPEEADQLVTPANGPLEVFLELRYAEAHNIPKAITAPKATKTKGRRAPKPGEASPEEFEPWSRGAMACANSGVMFAQRGFMWPLPVVSPLIQAIPACG